MSEIAKAVFTACVTVIVGVTVFAGSQILQRFVLDPVTEQRKLVGEITFLLTYWAWAYSNPYSNPNDPDRRDAAYDKASDELRSIAARLIASANVIRFQGLSERLGAIPRQTVTQVSTCLIRMANSMYRSNDVPYRDAAKSNVKDADAIRTLLGVALRGAR